MEIKEIGITDGITNSVKQPDRKSKFQELIVRYSETKVVKSWFMKLMRVKGTNILNYFLGKPSSSYTEKMILSSISGDMEHVSTFISKDNTHYKSLMEVLEKAETEELFFMEESIRKRTQQIVKNDKIYDEKMEIAEKAFKVYKTQRAKEIQLEKEKYRVKEFDKLVAAETAARVFLDDSDTLDESIDYGLIQ